MRRARFADGRGSRFAAPRRGRAGACRGGRRGRGPDSARARPPGAVGRPPQSARPGAGRQGGDDPARPGQGHGPALRLRPHRRRPPRPPGPPPAAAPRGRAEAACRGLRLARRCDRPGRRRAEGQRRPCCAACSGSAMPGIRRPVSKPCRPEAAFEDPQLRNIYALFLALYRESGRLPGTADLRRRLSDGDGISDRASMLLLESADSVGEPAPEIHLKGLWERWLDRQRADRIASCGGSKSPVTSTGLKRSSTSWRRSSGGGTPLRPLLPSSASEQLGAVS